jgi:HK97 gp10 family phage protein
MAEIVARHNGKVTARMSGSLAANVRALRSGATEALRPAAHAGALVFYREMRIRVPVDEGDLYAAIYRVHVDSKSNPTRQVYQVGPNVKKAPHWHLVEFGHWRVNVVVRGMDGRIRATTERLDQPVWVPAVPYIRPTFDATAGRAVQAMQERFAEALRETKTGWQ